MCLMINLFLFVLQPSSTTQSPSPRSPPSATLQQPISPSLPQQQPQPRNEVSNQTEGVNEEANLSSGLLVTTRETSNVATTGEVSEETAILAAAAAAHSELKFQKKPIFVGQKHIF